MPLQWKHGDLTSGVPGKALEVNYVEVTKKYRVNVENSENT